ncbi:MAG TPA: hypothetical protein VGB82_26995 [Alphaproteobacteria bacterium]
MAGDNLLRAELERVPRLPTEQQVPELLDIARRHPHSVKAARKRVPEQTQYTCFVYATRLLWSPSYIRIARKAKHFGGSARTPFFASPEFVRHLLDSGVLARISRGDAQEGDTIVYQENEKPVHAGVIVGGDLVRSKWGDGGRLFEHPMLEVPASYGDTVTRCRAIARADALKAFVRYIRTLPDFDEFQDYCGFEI